MTEQTKKRTDEELALASQSGDSKATEELLTRYSDLVRHLSRGFFLVGGETDDLIQEGMMGLCRAVAEYDAEKEKGCSFKTFAKLCVSRRIIDAVKKANRKKNAQPLPLDTAQTGVDLDPDEALILDDEQRELKEKMSRVLSDFEFKVASMYIEGMSCADITDATGRPYKSVDNALQRSKRKLSEIFGV